MTDTELKLRCLELALEQLRIERAGCGKKDIAELQMWFYNQITGELPETVKRRGRPPAGEKAILD
jgi:hypothetical protein